MDIVSEVLKETERIQTGKKNLSIDLSDFDQTREEKRQLKTALTNRIAPLLAENGFVKKSSCFFRAHDDALLQVIGVVYPHNGNFFIASKVLPLYDFFLPLWGEKSMNHNLIGSKNNNCPDEANPIEYTLGLSSPIKILSEQYDYEKPFQAMYVLLEQEIIPRLDSCTSGLDCIKYNQYEGSPIPLGVPLEMISLYCHDHMYDECMKQIEKCMKKICESIKEQAEEDELIPYPADGPVVFNDERRQAFHSQWIEITNWWRQFNYGAKALLEKLADLVNRKEERELRRMMNQSIRINYSYLEKASKKFAQKYPLQHLLHEDS